MTVNGSCYVCSQVEAQSICFQTTILQPILLIVRIMRSDGSNKCKLQNRSILTIRKFYSMIRGVYYVNRKALFKSA